MKRFLAIILSMLLLVTMLPVASLAAELQDTLSVEGGEDTTFAEGDNTLPVEGQDTTSFNGNSYKITRGTSTLKPKPIPNSKISYTLDEEGILRIWGSGAIPNYSQDGTMPPWFEGILRKDIRMISIEEGITEIGDYAFVLCKGLLSVRIPNSVTRIGKGAFMGCSSLEVVGLPDNLQQIGDSAFYSCDSLNIVALPASLRSIEKAAFMSCPALKYVFFDGNEEQWGNIEKDKFSFDLSTESDWKLYSGTPPTHTVTFDCQGGPDVTAETVISSDYVMKPVDPVREGYLFRGWCTDASCSNPFDFFWDFVSKDTTLYAKWELGTYIDTTGTLGTLLPEELNHLSVQTLIGEGNYTACLNKYGENAVVQVGVSSLDSYETVAGGLSGTPQMSEIFYALCNDLWIKKLPLEVDLLIGKNATALEQERSHYVLLFDVCFTEEIFDIAVATQSPDGERTLLPNSDIFRVDSWDYILRDEGMFIYCISSLKAYSALFTEDSAVWMGLEPKGVLNSSDYSIAAYEGWNADIQKFLDRPDLEITDQVFHQTDMATSGGVQAKIGPTDSGDSFAAIRSFTILINHNDVTQMIPIQILVFPEHKMISGKLYAASGIRLIDGFSFSTWENDLQVDSITLDPTSNYYENSEYWLRLTFFNSDGNYNGKYGIGFVKAAYVGRFESEDDASAAGAKDIKDELFSDAGYRANFSGDGVTFTIIDTDGEVHHRKFVVKGEISSVELEEPVYGAADTYFEAFAAYIDNPGSEKGYPVVDDSALYRRLNDDAYYDGYQTVFLLPEETHSLTNDATIYPVFDKGETVSIYAGQHDIDGKISSGTVQVSGESSVNLTGPVTTVQYSAAAENNICLKNYWVSYVTRDNTGGRLYVNGATNAIDAHKNEKGHAQRVVVLDEAHALQHNIFVSNIGNEALTIETTLTDAHGVQLDSHWTGSGTLQPFTSVADPDDNGMPSNSTKVTLVPVEGYEGEISGTLTITASNGEAAVMDLTGYAGNIEFTTQKARDAVKYVIYDEAIQTSSIASAVAVSFDISDGALPDGLEMRPNGIIYGMPTAVGKYTFTVRAALDLRRVGMKDGVTLAEKEYTINVLDNTDENVWKQTDVSDSEADDYRITIAIPNEDGSTSNINLGDQQTATTGGNSWENETLILESQGAYSEFQALYLDGVKLVPGVDYTSEEGSTRITAGRKSLKSGSGKTHTISTEFKKSSGRIKNSSQNIRTKSSSSGGGSSSSGGNWSGGNSWSGGGSSWSGGGSSGGGSSSGGWTPAKPPTPPTPPTPPAPVEYAVTVPKTEHGSATLDNSKAKKGDTVTITTVPDKNFQITMVVVKDKDGKTIPVTKIGENKYSFVMPDSQVTVNTTFSTVNPDVSPEERDERTPFTDVSKNKWYADSIAYVYKKGLMQGTSTSSFAPNSTTLRSMMVTILYRMAGEPETTSENFPDVPAETWYSKAASWAKQTGVFTGYTDGRLGVNDDITREQVVSVLTRYAEMQGIDVSSTNDLAKFPDNGTISTYARKAFGWAVENGIIQGTNKGFLNPRGNATRAEIATILMRADQKFDGEINKMNVGNDEADTDDKSDSDDGADSSDKIDSDDKKSSASDADNRENDPEND